MAWWNPFTWGEKTRDDILDKDNGLLAQVGGWIGNMNLTQEEVIEFNQKTVTSVHGFVQATLSENTERSKTRRSIAVMWIQTELFLILASVIVGMFDPTKAQFIFNVATSNVMLSGTTAIIIFFFGSHGIARYNESKHEQRK